MRGRDEDYIRQRAIDAAIHTIKNNTTVRQTAKCFGVSKSTIHKDLKQRLPKINYSLYEDVEEILRINSEEKHIRGGIATKELFEKQRENNGKSR